MEPWSAAARALVDAADARGAWVQTGSLPAVLKRSRGGPCDAAAVLHVLRRWTLDQHFCKAIWRVDALGDEEQAGEPQRRCFLRHLLRKHVIGAAGTAGDGDEDDRLAEWVLWEGPQWAAVDAAALAAERAGAGPEPEPEPQPEPQPQPAQPVEHKPGPGREEVMCETCGKMVMVSELSIHEKGKKHRRAVRLAAEAAGEVAPATVPDPEPEPEPEPHPPELPPSDDPALEEVSYHRAVFGPLALSQLGPDDARQFVLPYDYPKARAYAIAFREYRELPAGEQPEEKQIDAAELGPLVKATLTMEVLPFSFLLEEAAADATPTSIGRLPSQHMGGGARRTLTTLLQWAGTTDVTSGKSTHVEHQVFDVALSQAAFRSEYVRMKEKYGKKWVACWPEQTDPAKYVYEEIAIAAWLLALWREEQAQDEEQSGRPVKFVDLGCGNGFLTYLLIEEGHSGWGIDRQRRGIWKDYPPAVQQSLLCAEVEAATCVDTLAEQFEGVEWVLGNHTDELTPWVPVIARRLAEAQQSQPLEEGGAGAVMAGDTGSAALALRNAGAASIPRLQSPLPSASPSWKPPRFWVLACCLWDIGPGGEDAKFIGHDVKLGRYHTYVAHIEAIAVALGYSVVRDTMRIPSTKNICLVGSAGELAAGRFTADGGGGGDRARRSVDTNARARRPVATGEGSPGTAELAW